MQRCLVGLRWSGQGSGKSRQDSFCHRMSALIGVRTYKMVRTLTGRV
jgi:hypothetical protein